MPSRSQLTSRIEARPTLVASLVIGALALTTLSLTAAESTLDPVPMRHAIASAVHTSPPIATHDGAIDSPSGALSVPVSYVGPLTRSGFGSPTTD